MVAFTGSRHVTSKRRCRGDLEFLKVELAHLLEAETLALAQGKEGHLQSSAPAEAQIHREVALHLVHDAETGRRIRQALASAQEIRSPVEA